ESPRISSKSSRVRELGAHSSRSPFPARARPTPLPFPAPARARPASAPARSPPAPAPRSPTLYAPGEILSSIARIVGKNSTRSTTERARDRRSSADGSQRPVPELLPFFGRSRRSETPKSPKSPRKSPQRTEWEILARGARRRGSAGKAGGGVGRAEGGRGWR